MKDQFKNAWNNIKEFWKRQSKKVKMLVGFVAGGILLGAVALTIYLNMAAGQYQVLFPGITSAEAQEVYATLQSMEVTPQMNAKGEIMVPREQWDNLVFELAGKGYPKTAPAYDIFQSNTGFTTTEFEKKQALIFQVQNRIQDTLSRIEGVEGTPVVTITVPDDNTYVWQESKQESTAGVLIGMRSGYSLTPERVSAIRNLVAFSVPKLSPENVRVVDQQTGLEIEADSDDLTTAGINFKRLEYEREMEKTLEENVRRLLKPRYGEGVTAVAKVMLDYDDTKLESRRLVPEDNGEGVKTHYEDRYTVNGSVPAQGIVGEENNTDVPRYPNQTGGGEGETSDFSRSIDYDISYELTQISKGQATIKEASIAVVVNDANFTTERQDLLIDLISKGVHIDKNSISVTNLDFETTPADATGGDVDKKPKLKINPIVLAISGGLLLLLIVIVLLLFRHRSKKHVLEEQESENVIRDLQAEIEQHKRELMETAQANNSKENAITNEVRDFAKENPEITASLIRSLLKEDE